MSKSKTMETKLSALKALFFAEHFVLMTPSKFISTTPKDRTEMRLMQTVVKAYEDLDKKAKK